MDANDSPPMRSSAGVALRRIILVERVLTEYGGNSNEILPGFWRQEKLESSATVFRTSGSSSDLGDRKQ